MTTKILEKLLLGKKVNCIRIIKFHGRTTFPARYLKNSQGVMRVSLAPLGGLSMMSRSGGLKDRAVAGRPSVTRFTWTRKYSFQVDRNMVFLQRNTVFLF